MHTLSREHICDTTVMGFILDCDEHSGHADNVTDEAPGKGTCIYWHSFETYHTKGIMTDRIRQCANMHVAQKPCVCGV